MSDYGGDDGGGDYGGGDDGGGDYGGENDVQMTTFESDYPAETSYSSPKDDQDDRMTYFESSYPADESSYPAHESNDDRRSDNQESEKIEVEHVDVSYSSVNYGHGFSGVHSGRRWNDTHVYHHTTYVPRTSYRINNSRQNYTSNTTYSRDCDDLCDGHFQVVFIACATVIIFIITFAILYR